MKIAISGKGGVGKTTLTAMLAAALASSQRQVIAVDADPDANLAAALGVPEDEPLHPITEMRELIAERTGAQEGYGSFFKLNPRVDDLPQRFARAIGNIRLLVLGGVSKGGAGCICPATALLKALLNHLVLYRDEAVIMDLEAGIEHLGRATAQSMDVLIVVVDDGPWSLASARRIRALAEDIGLRKLAAVVNRVTPQTDLSRLQRALEPIPLIGRVPCDPRLAQPLLTLDRNGGFEKSEVLLEFQPFLVEIMEALTACTHTI